MGKKEKRTVPVICYTALGATGGYLILQFVNALLMSKEVVGEGGAQILVAVSGMVAVLVSLCVFGRREQKQRLLLGLGTAGILIAIQILGAFSFGDFSHAIAVWPGIWAATLLGGAVGALIGCGGKRRKRVSSRRR